MNSLERRLDELGAHWDAPATPDVTAAVQTARVSHRRRAPRRVAVAFAATLVVFGALAAIAPARNAILDFFDVGGVRVVERPTTAPPPDQGSLGTEASLRTAHAEAPFPLRLPTAPPRRPDRVFVQRPPQDGAFAFVWNSVPALARGELVLTQFRGRLIAEKRIDPNVTTVEHVTVDGVDGVWLSGGPHAIGYLDSDGAFRTETLRQVGDVLVWERLGVTYRIEGARSLTAARSIADSLP